MINNKIQNNKGYTLLFAVLVSSIVLSVGISILTISKKEYLLSSSARESVTAFYAADSGLECAIYHNDAFDDFASTTASSKALSTPECMGQHPIIASFTWSPNISEATFNVKMQSSAQGDACAVVKVRKDYYLDTSYGWFATTTITSRGYNLGWNDTAKTCNLPSPRRVERAIEYIF